MSIPLDRLYHYIESVARDIRGDNVIIYRFSPHGSKKIEDLRQLGDIDYTTIRTCPEVYCYDQEPLNYNLYANHTGLYQSPEETVNLIKKYNLTLPDVNLCVCPWNIFDKSILLHSERRSTEINKYHSNKFIPTYYWSHGIIARDWYRFGQHVRIRKDIEKTFLIYNRAWSGTREYRLKFIDLLIKDSLINHCQTSVKFAQDSLHYTQHQFKNPIWKPTHTLEDYLVENLTNPQYSAEFDTQDYSRCEVEVVLETLFDDTRLHLTEKTLRPIALGQPFLLMATHGSLAYLRNYGFKTFNHVFDESYDTIEDPYKRMVSVIDTMKTIAGWSESEKQQKMNQLTEITEYNKNWFYSNEFFNMLVDELKHNLKKSLIELENTNTCRPFFDLRKYLFKHEEFKFYKKSDELRKQAVEVVKSARVYYNRYLKTLNK